MERGQVECGLVRDFNFLHSLNMGIKDPREVSRSMATQLGRQTLELLDQGSVTVLSVSHDLRPAIEHSRNGTAYYPPDSVSLSSWASTRSLNAYTTSINIQEISTIDGALQLAQHGERPGVLNFASAKHPGGGWLNGSRAQVCPGCPDSC